MLTRTKHLTDSADFCACRRLPSHPGSCQGFPGRLQQQCDRPPCFANFRDSGCPPRASRLAWRQAGLQRAKRHPRPGSRIGATRVHAPRCHSQPVWEAAQCSGPADSSRETKPWAVENRTEEGEREDEGEESQRRERQTEHRQVSEDPLQGPGIPRCLTGQPAEARTGGRERTG